MDDLVAFLNARLVEREGIAQSAANSGGRSWVAMGSLLLRLENGHADPDIAEATNYRYDPVLEHAAANDPAVVLADVAAKREIIAEHTESATEEFEGRARTTTWCPICPGGDCKTVRLLGLPNAGHPDYQESWKP